MGLFFANLKQTLLTLFCHLNYPKPSQKKPFKGFCDFLNISDWLIVPFE